jgi:pSer/pThr/pTyr-binding forkhead associated (FHA) protein
LIGRQESLPVSLMDDWVSRRHARIYRCGDEFILEDLSSSNGTYVDGVPIISCVLRAGDWIQIGRNLFRFEMQLDNASGSGDVTTWLE